MNQYAAMKQDQGIGKRLNCDDFIIVLHIEQNKTCFARPYANGVRAWREEVVNPNEGKKLTKMRQKDDLLGEERESEQRKEKIEKRSTTNPCGP